MIKYNQIITERMIQAIYKEVSMAQGKISPKQQEILEYIKSQILERGFPPAVRDICEAVHLKSTSSVHSHLETLEKNGYIRRDPTKPRAIEILDESFNFTRREMVNVPMVGRVAAGEPLLAEQNVENYFPIPMEFMPNNQTFMLRVKGDSMINIGIFDGDLVLVEQRQTARNGEVIVALVEDGATVKRFFKEEGVFRLQPENDALDPIIVKEVQILGKVIGVFRFLS
ncbi:repressor LexA [[Clostridium] scindens ATCC 35704]|nr:repressor LexA [[Clostridium] scindens ATCC 35704]